MQSPNSVHQHTLYPSAPRPHHTHPTRRPIVRPGPRGLRDASSLPPGLLSLQQSVRRIFQRLLGTNELLDLQDLWLRCERDAGA